MMSEVVIKVVVKTLISDNCSEIFHYDHNLGGYEVVYEHLPSDYWDILSEEEQREYISNLVEEYINECVTVITTVEYTDE